MVVKKGTELVKGSNRKSIVPVPKERTGDLALRVSRPPTVFQVIKENEIAHAAERLRKQNLKRSKAEYAEKREMFAHAKKGEWGPVFEWLESKEYQKINERDDHGKTLLMVAASEGNLKATADLMDKGAYSGLTDKYERSALIHALRNEHYEVARFLRGAGVKWESDLTTALRDGRVLLVKTMQTVLEISDGQVAAIEATLDPNRGPALSHRLEGLGEEADAQQELTVMFQSATIKESATSALEKGADNASALTGQKKPFTSFRGC